MRKQERQRRQGAQYTHEQLEELFLNAALIHPLLSDKLDLQTMQVGLFKGVAS